MWKNGSFTQDCHASIESSMLAPIATCRNVASVSRTIVDLEADLLQLALDPRGGLLVRLPADAHGELERHGLADPPASSISASPCRGRTCRATASASWPGISAGSGLFICGAVAHQHVGHDRVDRDGVVDRLAHLDVVERPLLGVHAQPVAGRVRHRDDGIFGSPSRVLMLRGDRPAGRSPCRPPRASAAAPGRPSFGTNSTMMLWNWGLGCRGPSSPASTTSTPGSCLTSG